MRFTSQPRYLAVLAVLTASAIASPLQARQDPVEHALKRQNEDANHWCGLTEELQDMASAEKALERTTLGASVGMFIRLVQGNSDRWLEGLQQYIYRDEQMEGANARSCATLGGDCSPGKGEACRDVFADAEEGDTWPMDAYWIFKATKGIHAKLTLLRDKLQEETIITNLKIGEMAKQFEASLNDDFYDADDVLDWMQVALGIDSSAMSFSEKLNPVYSTATGVLGTVMSFADDHSKEEEEGKVSLEVVQSRLGSHFKESKDGIERTLRAAMGLAWSKQEEDYENLPSMAYDWLHEEQVANFYDSPFWLLDDSAQPVDEMLSAATVGIRVHIVDMIIQRLGYAILWDTEVEDEGSCDGSGRKWMHVGGKGRCFTLYTENGNSFQKMPKDSSIPETMAKWGIDDLEVYFQSSIDCAKSKCEKPQKVGVGSVTNEGLPLCYFSAPVKRLTSDYVPGCEKSTGGCVKRKQRVDFIEKQDECPN